MKSFVSICLIPLVATFIFGCGADDAANAVNDALTIPDPGGGGGGPGPEPQPEPEPIPEVPAEGKVNGKAFKPKVAYLAADPFSSTGAELVLTEDDGRECWTFYDQYIVVPIRDRDNFEENHAIPAGNSDFDNMILFYDYANGGNVNANIIKSGGMNWKIDKNGESLKAGINIPAEGSNDKNYIVGNVPVVNCL